MAEQELNGLKILWVEDDSFLAEFISKTLKTAGADIIYTNTGEQAIEKVDAGEAFDVVLCDLLLPGVDGWDVITKVRSTETTANTPIIVFSNLGRQEEVNKGIELGADRFIVKSSIHPRELVAEIMKAIESRKNKA